MKKTSNRLHSLFAALAALILAAALAVPAFAVEGGFADLYYRMNDSAGVLTEDENNELEDALEELSLRQSFDVTIATVESLESVDYDSMEAYADDLYDSCQFGYGSDMDGVLLLVSVGDRKWHISPCGYGITAFTDGGIQYLGQQMTPFMADGDYAGAFRTFVQWSDTYIDAARAGHPYDVNNLPREPLSLMYLFQLGAFPVEDVPCAGMGRRQRNEKPAAQRGVPGERRQLCAGGQHESDQQPGAVPVPGCAAHRACGGKGLRQLRWQLHPHLFQRHDPRRWRRFVLKGACL